MTCEKCHESEMVPTQVPRVAQALRGMGDTVALSAVLTLGAVFGLGLAVVSQGGVDFSWVVIATPVILLLSTPLVVVGAMRAFAEKKVWQCKHCDYTLDRA